MKNRNLPRQAAWVMFAGAVALAVSACGGGGSDGGGVVSGVASGVFVDAPVQGLAYTSGAISGTTDALGTFQYEPGQSVTFALGNVTVGTIAIGKSRVYPIDLVPGATDETHATVSNIVRLLQTLDDDGDPSNGILITPAVRNSLTTALDFAQAKAAFAADPAVTAAIATATALRTGGVTTLKDAAAAEAHFRSTLLADFAGNWVGSYVGTSGPVDNGSCTVTVSALGAASGTCQSIPFNQTIAVAGNIASNGSAVITGITNTGAAFSGTFSRSGTASGTWANTAVGTSGTWQVSKN